MQPNPTLELDELKSRCSGKTRTMIRVLDSFLGSSANLHSKLQSTESSGDPAAIGKTLHTIKGLLQEISAKDAAGIMEEFETKLREKNEFTAEDLSSVKELINTASRAAEEAKEILSLVPASSGQ